VKQRFGSWAEFLAERPFDELFSMELQPSATTADTGEARDGNSIRALGEDDEEPTIVVVRPRLVSAVQRARILARARLILQKRLQDEFSVWWREGKVPLPEYTQRRVTWWDHTPPLPFGLQIMSRPADKYRIFDERFLYKQQLVRARNERRKERRSEWQEEQKKVFEAKKKAAEERRQSALSAVTRASCGGLLGRGRAGAVARVGG